MLIKAEFEESSVMKRGLHLVHGARSSALLAMGIQIPESHFLKHRYCQNRFANTVYDSSVSILLLAATIKRITSNATVTKRQLR
jgi:hypothetical protein